MESSNGINIDTLISECKVGENLPAEEIIASLKQFLAVCEEENIAFYFNKFLEAERNPDVIIFIIKILDKYKNEDTLGVLIDFLILKGVFKEKSEEKYTQARILATKAITNCKDTKAVFPLLYCLNDKHEDYKLRLACAEALGKIGDKYAVSPLIEVVSDEEEKSVYLRESAAFALGMIGDSQAVDPLVSILEAKKGFIDKFTYLKERVIEALGRLDSKNSRVFNALKHSLSDESAHIRISAIEALMNLDDERSIPLIKEMLLDRDVEVTKNATIALYNLLGTSALYDIINDNELSAATKAIAQELIEEEQDDEE